MAGPSVSEPGEVVLTDAEWDEIERCSMASMPRFKLESGMKESNYWRVSIVA